LGVTSIADLIFKSCRQPDKLDELNLDAFAEELERQGFGNKQITLYDIRSELNHMYKDNR
jgi:transcription elongation factor SPT6